MGPQPAVSSSYIKGLLAARCKTNAKSKASTSGGVVKRRYKRRKRRRRAPARTATRTGTGTGTVRATRTGTGTARATRTGTGTGTVRSKAPPPKKKTAEIAVQTSDYMGDDFGFESMVSVETSNSQNGKNSKKKIKKETKTKTEMLDKKPSILDVITLSDDDVTQNNDDVTESYDGPSTSRGHVGSQIKKQRTRCRALESSDEEEEEKTSVLKQKTKKKTEKKTETKTEKLKKNTPIDKKQKTNALLVASSVSPFPLTTSEKVTSEVTSEKVTSEVEDSQAVALRNVMVHDFLFTPPIAAAIVKHLPMKSLNSLGQVNQLLRDICRQEKLKKRRQKFDWFLRPSIISTLDGDRMQNEKRIFGNLISNIFCQPDLIIAFCSPRIFYDFRMNFDERRSPYLGRYKILHDVVSDLMPDDVTTKGSSKIVHIRTHGVMSPLPMKGCGNRPIEGCGNSRKKDEFGFLESPRDFCLLCIPKIDGVNVWREYLSDSDLKKQLRNSGWLESRAQNHFLLPVIKDMELLSPKLVIIFSRRLANFANVTSPSFPVIVLNVLNSTDEISFSNFQQNSNSNSNLNSNLNLNLNSNFGLEFLFFGGDVFCFQVFLGGASGRVERSSRISFLREQFSAQEVMSQRMLLFYFRNVSKFETENLNEKTKLFQEDIFQLREEFPRVPLFGGGYENVVGNVFTKEKTAPDFGKFFSGLHSAVVCGVVLGSD